VNSLRRRLALSRSFQCCRSVRSSGVVHMIRMLTLLYRVHKSLGVVGIPDVDANSSYSKDQSDVARPSIRRDAHGEGPTFDLTASYRS